MTDLPEPTPQRDLAERTSQRDVAERTSQRDLAERRAPAERLPHSDLRAADADREQVAAVLREAAAEGRLDLSELDERLSRVYAAKTYGELEPLIGDLPAAGMSVPAARLGPSVPATHLPTSGGGVAFMSEFKRQGRWAVARRFRCLAFWGGGKVDLREAVFAQGPVKIRAFAIMGGIDVIVSEETNLHVTGIGIMGGFDQGASGAGAPGAPTVIVSGFSFWGGVSVKRRPMPAELKRRKAERKAKEGNGPGAD
jgi:DUF1707 SHOCT-like domain